MMDRSRRLSEPVRWTRAGRMAVATVGLLAVLAVVGVGIYAVAGGFKARTASGCIDVAFASTTGAAHLHACGAQAREICASRQAHAGLGDALRGACERARDPFGGAP
jgi:hypothetical protein